MQFQWIIVLNAVNNGNFVCNCKKVEISTYISMYIHTSVYYNIFCDGTDKILKKVSVNKLHT